MKRILKFVMLVLLSHMFVEIANADEPKKTVEDVELKIGNGDADNTNKHPRTLIPITCVYTEGAVQLTMLENLGEIQLIVTNHTTGEQWRTVNNWVLQTSTANGVYLVEIITEDGTTYWGTYTL